MDDLTVQHPITDPYRSDTRAHHAEARWVAEQIERFVRAGQPVHLRGLHYLIASSDDVIKLNGDRYINSDNDWEYLQTISNPARWLGYVPFDRLRDERSSEIASFVPEEGGSYTGLSCGLPIELPTIRIDSGIYRVARDEAALSSHSRLREELSGDRPRANRATRRR